MGSLVAVSRDALPAPAEATGETLNGPGHWVTCLPTNHIAGLQTQFRSATVGLTSIDTGAGRPENFARAVDFNGKSVPLCVSLVLTQLRRLLASSAVRAARRFDAILVGGAAVGARLLEAARATGLKVVTTYEMTETCDDCVYDESPTGDARVVVKDDRIVLSGSAVVPGYMGGPDSAGTSRTSGVGHLEADRLTAFGRTDGAITTGSMTIMPAVVKETLARSGAGESVVVGTDDNEWGEIAVVVVDATGFSRPTASKMRETIIEEHGKTHIPRLFLSLSGPGLSDLEYSESGSSSPKPSGTDSGGLLLTASGKSGRRVIRELVRCALDRRSPSS